MASIAYIGNFTQTWHTEEHLAHDFEALGHEVYRLSEGSVHQWLEGTDDLGVAPLAQRLSIYDLVLYTKTHGLPRAEALELWARLADAGIPTASFHLDLYRGLGREAQVGVDPFWATRHVFTADGGSIAFFAERGVNHWWCPPAVVSHEAIVTEGRYVADRGEPIVFVGSSRHYHPEWPWRPRMLAALRAHYGDRFGVYGPSENGEVVRGLDLNRLYQQPGRVVVGDSLALPGHANYWSDRYFETVGRGGFLIAPQVEGLDRFLTSREHYQGFEPGDPDRLIELIDGHLEDPNEALEVAEAGRRHVADLHTYKDRARLILDVSGVR